jgi:hypothetical protein
VQQQQLQVVASVSRLAHSCCRTKNINVVGTIIRAQCIRKGHNSADITAWLILPLCCSPWQVSLQGLLALSAAQPAACVPLDLAANHAQLALQAASALVATSGNAVPATAPRLLARFQPVTEEQGHALQRLTPNS